MKTVRRIELLAPAKNVEIGQQAILHGADAVYIGAPRFGARSTAGNSIADLARLIDFAHRFDARVYITLNTILRDDELRDAERLIHELYKISKSNCFFVIVCSELSETLSSFIKYLFRCKSIIPI